MFTVRYYDRTKAEMVTVPIPSDGLEVSIPEQEGLPALRLAINSAAVMVEDAGYKCLATYAFSDIVAAAQE